MSVVNPVVAGGPATSGQYNGLLAPWDTFAPGTGNFNVGNGSLLARYYQQGKTVATRIAITAGSTTVYTGSAAVVGLPVVAHSSGEQEIPLKLYTGSATYVGLLIVTAGGAVGNIYIPSAPGDCRLVPMTSSTPNMGTAGNLVIEGIYEAA